MKKQYDYLIVGTGLFGSVFAHELHKSGKKCLLIDKRSHSGGNTYCEYIEGINVHKYGAHIFHTNDVDIWTYINQFAVFNNYINSPLASCDGEIYNLPFNMNTFYKLWGVKTPSEAKYIIDKQIFEANVTNPQNLEEQALKLVGAEIYEKFIKHYSEKQWGRKAVDLPPFIIKRIPIRLTYNNNYFNDRFQGIPVGGYNTIIDNLLAGIDVKFSVDFFTNRSELTDLADKIVFTGKIDQYFDYKYGKLEYRSLKFETEILDVFDYQGNAVVNFTDNSTKYTRIIEHKHFEFGNQAKTVITKEYPLIGSDNLEPYYPINDKKNNDIFRLYDRLADREVNVIFGGRLAEYKYYDMHQVIASALKKSKLELSEPFKSKGRN